MLKFTTNIIALILFFASISLSLVLIITPNATEAAFDLFRDSCTGVSGSPACNDANSANANNNPVARTIRQVAFVVSFIVGVGATIVVILGGFRYVTSGGDPNKASQGKDMIIYALIGIIVTSLAGAIVYFITERFL